MAVEVKIGVGLSHEARLEALEVQVQVDRHLVLSPRFSRTPRENSLFPPLTDPANTAKQLFINSKGKMLLVNYY